LIPLNLGMSTLVLAVDVRWVPTKSRAANWCSLSETIRARAGNCTPNELYNSIIIRSRPIGSALKGRGATDDEIRADHNDLTRLRAFCRVCNGSHKYEKRKTVDYTSDPDEEGYHTPDDEPENAGFYKGFRFDPPDRGSSGAGITT
jgi:hypothetical protein